MNMRLVLVLGLFATPALAAASTPGSVVDERGISLRADGRAANLTGGLELDSSIRLSSSTVMQLSDEITLGLAAKELPALTFGAGLDRGTRPVIALLLGLLIGFGTGHLIAQDRNGFILWLVVDLVILVVFGVFSYALPGLWFGLPSLAWLISHIIQGLDAYGQAGGARIVEWTREKAVMVASTDESRDAPAITSKILSLSF